MNKKIVSLTVILMSTALPIYAGGFSLPSLGSDKPAANAGDQGAAAAVMQESVVQKYMAASREFTTAQIELAQAFDLKDQAAALQAQATVLGSGATLDKDGIAKQTQVSEAADKAIQAKIGSSTEITEEGKKHYVAALSPFGRGVLQTAGMPAELTAFGNSAQAQITNAPMLEKLGVTNKFKAGLYLVKELPGYTSRMYSSLKSVVTYGQKVGIEMPKDATAALGN